MLITLLKSKIHRAVVTDTQLDYEGSCGISTELLEAANIKEYEQIHIYNITNGARFTTYAINAGPGEISIRGSAARYAQPSDILIICTYCQVSEDSEYTPIKVYVDNGNKIPLFQIEYFDIQDIKDCMGVIDRLYTTIEASSVEAAKAIFNNTYCDEYQIFKVTKV